MKTWNECINEVGRKLGWLPLLGSSSTQVPLSFAKEVANLYREEGIKEAIKLARERKPKYWKGNRIPNMTEPMYTESEILEKLISFLG